MDIHKSLVCEWPHKTARKHQLIGIRLRKGLVLQAKKSPGWRRPNRLSFHLLFLPAIPFQRLKLAPQTGVWPTTQHGIELKIAWFEGQRIINLHEYQIPTKLGCSALGIAIINLRIGYWLDPTNITPRDAALSDMANGQRKKSKRSQRDELFQNETRASQYWPCSPLATRVSVSQCSCAVSSRAWMGMLTDSSQVFLFLVCNLSLHLKEKVMTQLSFLPIMTVCPTWKVHDNPNCRFNLGWNRMHVLFW